ncbi:DUF6264 family protein [Desulfococcus sp.]|uniref:DUF6264 family protein n=1 Tax=Desulfococcus sp. TaxID=2025834 RepID=UPI003592EFB3
MGKSEQETDHPPDPGQGPVRDPKAARGGGPPSGPAPEPISARGRAFLDELTAFVGFLQGLWGALAGAAVFFPLANASFTVIPMAPLDREGAFHILPAGLVTAIATLLTLFVLFSAFSRRRVLADAGRKAWIPLIAGVLVLIGYLILHTVKMNLFDIWGVESGHPAHLAFELPMMVLYAAFFALTARAFVLLGLLEIHRRP